MDSSPFSIRSSKSLLNQHKIIGNQAGIGSFQKYFQTCKTAREKIATAQKQEQNVMQANNIQQQQQNSQMSLQIFQSSPIITPRTLQTQSNRQSQRLSFNFSNLNNYEQESAKQSRSKQRDQVLYFNDYNIIQQNIHNKQMDNHSQIFTVKPFFYTKNQQNVEVMKALPEKNKIREKNKDHSNFQNSDGLKNFTKHQKSNTTNLNEINREYFFKTSEELINFYNLNTSRKDLKRQTFQSTSETFRKNSEQEQQKIFQNQSQFVKNFNTIYDNLNEKVFEDLRPDNFFKIQTINDENFQSFHSINTNIQSNLDPKLTFDKQKSSIAENQRNIIRSQSNPNITQNCMQFNRKYSNQKLNQSPILTNLQEIKLKTTPPISLIEKPLTQREARFKLSINSHKNSIDTLASQDQLYQKEVKNIQRPISPILLQNDSYDEKNFYRQKLQQNTHKKIKSQLLSKTEESILNESIQQQDIQNMDLQQSFCQSIQSCNQQQLNSKQVSLSNSPRKLNFVQMNRNATKFINKQNANNSKKKTDINPICFQEYKDIDEQEPKYNQEDILKQIIKCRQKLKPKNQMTKETKQDKLVKIKKQLLNYQESSTDLQNIQTSKESSDMTQQQNKKSSKQIIAKKESLVKEQFDYIQSSTGYSFYPNFDEVQNQKSLSSSNQQTNTLQNYEKSPPIYNQNSFTSTKHNMFRQKPQKLFLLHNSTNYQKIQKIESIIKNNKNENIK